MAMLKIKKGDTVKVIAGKDKDKEGKVISVDRPQEWPCAGRRREYDHKAYETFCSKC